MQLAFIYLKGTDFKKESFVFIDNKFASIVYIQSEMLFILSHNIFKTLRYMIIYKPVH